MQDTIDQICKPFSWTGTIAGEEFAIYVESLDKQTYQLFHGYLAELDPWRARSLAMYVHWFLISQGVQLPVAIDLESIEAMRAEVLEVKPAAPKGNAIADRKVVGPEHFAVNPADIKSYVGARRIQHAPPATSPVGYTEDGEMQIMPDASPRRVMGGRLNW